MRAKNITVVKAPHLVLMQLQRISESSNIIFTEQENSKSDAVLIWGRTRDLQVKTPIVIRLAHKPIGDSEFFFHQETPLYHLVSEINQIL